MGGLEEWGPDCDWASGKKKEGSKERKLPKQDLRVLFGTENWPVQVSDCHCWSLGVDIFEKCQFKKPSEAWIQWDDFAVWKLSSSHRFLWSNEVLSGVLCNITCFRFSPLWWLWVWLFKGSITITHKTITRHLCSEKTFLPHNYFCFSIPSLVTS